MIPIPSSALFVKRNNKREQRSLSLDNILVLDEISINYTCLRTGQRLTWMFIDIDIEILFFVEYSQTCNISPVGLLFRQTRVKQHAKKNITACNKKQYVQ